MTSGREPANRANAWQRYLTVLLLAVSTCMPLHAQQAKGLNELGSNYFQQERYEEALERFEKAYALAPEVPAVRRNLCLTHQILARKAFEAEDVAKALDHLEKASIVMPENPAPVVQAGSYLLGTGDFDAARKRLEAALERDPQNLEAKVLLGELHYRDFDFDKAKQHWKDVLEAKPDWPGLAKKLAKLDREQGVESDFQSYSSEHFEIRYGKVLSEVMRKKVFGILEAAYQEIGKALGDIYPPDIIQVVLYEGQDFADATGSDRHIGALFDGRIRAPITNRKGRYLGEATLKSRLWHEYVHVVIRYHLGAAAPWWLNEGLAETLSREMDLNRIRKLRQAYQSGATHAFADLETDPRERLNPNQVTLAYSQAHVAVSHVWEQHAKQFPAFLAALRSGAPTETALKETFGLDYPELDRQTKAACQS